MAAIESIAHRGWSAIYPENTLRAFDEALRLGVTGCECDVHLSRDGVPYLMHDHSFRRTTGRPEASDALTMAEIATLDAGSWKASEFAGEGIPTLAAALAVHRGRGHFVIELKDAGEPAHVAAQVAAVIDGAGARQACSLIAFSFDHLVAVAQEVPEVRACWLLSKVPDEGGELAAHIARVREHGLSGLSVNHGAVTAELADALHQAGLLLWVWTVNDDDALDRMLGVGVDSITSDRPDWLLARLGS